MSQVRPHKPVEQKRPVLRDRKYLDWLRSQPCAVTGNRPTSVEATDPAHIGTAGRGVKSPDNEALPIRHRVHQLMHQHGEIETLLRYCGTSDYGKRFFKECLRAYAREMYEKWKNL